MREVEAAADFGRDRQLHSGEELQGHRQRAMEKKQRRPERRRQGEQRPPEAVRRHHPGGGVEENVGRAGAHAGQSIEIAPEIIDELQQMHCVVPPCCKVETRDRPAKRRPGCLLPPVPQQAGEHARASLRRMCL